MEMVILVDKEDNEIGTMEKMEAHEKGALHRAFSVIIYNSKGEMLLQKRAASKYHSGGLWTNACCSHPVPDEAIADTVRRRLKEEMGIDAQPRFSYKFLYRTPLDKNLIEHELDYVFVAEFNGVPTPDDTEADDWKFVDVAWLRDDVKKNPDHYTYWFKLILNHPQLQVHN